MSNIRAARLRAGLTQTDVAAPLGRGPSWLAHCENGSIPVSAALEAHIVKTIKRLVAFNEMTRESRAQLVADLQLPPQASDTIR